jgi:hypothetical protein
MKLRLRNSLLSISLFALALGGVEAQTADDFFHSGARSYLSNNIPGAKEVVSNGLTRFPDDIKLKKLDELLKQQQQGKQGQQNQQQQQNQSQQNQSQSKQDQQKQSQEQKQKEQQKQQKQKQDQQKEKQGGGQQKEQQLEAGQMSPEQAKQLMDQQKADEMLLPNSRKEKPRDQSHPVKDW